MVESIGKHCFIIVKVLGSIHYTYNLNACLEG